MKFEGTCKTVNVTILSRDYMDETLYSTLILTHSQAYIFSENEKYHEMSMFFEKK